jgi:hypothetical protein
LARTEIVKDADLAWFRARWDPAGERLFYIMKKKEAEGRESFVMAVYSLPEAKTVAEKIIARSEEAMFYYSASWMPDGRSIIVADRDNRAIIFLGPDLQETSRIPLPSWLKDPWENAVIGRQVLIVDGPSDALWRLDLDTKRWKRLY